MPVSEALDRLAAMEIRTRAGISVDDLLFSLGGTSTDSVNPVHLLCVMGGEVERGEGGIISDDIWHLDAECISDDGDYVALARRFSSLAKGALPLEALRDHVEVAEGVAWIEFILRGEKIKWELEVDGDWLAPEFYSNFQALVRRVDPRRGFFICALGQDSLVSYGDAKLKEELSRFAGLSFEWE